MAFEFKPTVGSTIEPFAASKVPEDPEPILPQRQMATSEPPSLPPPLERVPEFVRQETLKADECVQCEPKAQFDMLQFAQTLGSAFLVGAVVGGVLAFSFSKRVVSEE